MVNRTSLSEVQMNKYINYINTYILNCNNTHIHQRTYIYKFMTHYYNQSNLTEASLNKFREKTSQG